MLVRLLAIIEISTAGTTGALSFHTSLNGAAFAQQTSTGTGAGNISGFDTDGSGAFSTGTISTAAQRLQISQGNLGTNDTLVVRVSGASGGIDTSTFFRVRNGATGTAAITVVVQSNNTNIFRNAAGTAKTLTATVYDNADGSTISGSNVTYRWFNAGTNNNLRVTSSTDRSVLSSMGATCYNWWG